MDEEIYLASNQSFHKIGEDRWIFNWKGQNLKILTTKEIKKLLKKENQLI